MDLITLADLPALKGDDPEPRTTITIGRLDANLRDPRYGKFSISQGDVDSWKRNLAGVFGGQVSIDFDHSSDRGNGTRAAAWISGIDQTGTKDGSLITADVQFTRRGAKAVRDGDYKYTSPTFVENYTDEHGQKHGKALIGAALTNRPVLRKGMPTLSLSRDSFEGVATVPVGGKRERKRARKQVAQLLAAGSDGPRDSRPQMDKLSALRKLLALDEDADAVTILAAAAAVALPTDGDKHPSPSHTPGVEAKATPEANDKAAKKARKLAKKGKADDAQTMALDEDGHVLLSQEDYANLLIGANAGQSAAVQLADQTFTTAWEKALDEGRAAPSQEANLRELHAVNPELAVKTLDSFVKIVPTKPTGSGDNPNTGPAPAGMDEERFQLHTEAKQLAAQKAAANPKLDEGEAYILAINEISERQFALENPGI